MNLFSYILQNSSENSRCLTCRPGDGDQALPDAMNRGDVSAFAALYDLHSPAIYALCLHYCEKQAQAEEMLESVFWRFWQNRSSLRCPPDRAYRCILAFVLQSVIARPKHIVESMPNNLIDEQPSTETPEFPLNPYGPIC